MNGYALKSTFKNGHSFLWSDFFTTRSLAIDKAIEEFPWIEGPNRNAIWKKLKRRYGLSIIKVKMEEI
jgi:hypothetical protein